MKGKFDLSIYILFATIAGALAGVIFGESAGAFAPLGQLFIKLIMMPVVPMVAVSIILGTSSIGSAKSAGKLGVYCFALYLFTTLVSCLMGLGFGVAFNIGGGVDLSQLQGTLSNEYADYQSQTGFWVTVLNLVPSNPVEMLLSGNILQVLFFSMFLGFGLSALPESKKAPVFDRLNALNDVFIWMIHKIILTAPIGVFGLMADAIGTFGFDLLGVLIEFLALYAAVVLLHVYGVYSLLIEYFTNYPLLRFFRIASEPQLVALSTSSSMATLPVTMQTCEEKMGISKETSAFVLPLGATINMDGGGIHYALAAVFCANLFGMDLNASQYVAIVLTSTLGSIGQAGIPGPSLLLVAVLMAAKIPVEAIPLVFAVDRLADMIRTACNVTGDVACALIVDKTLNKDG